MKDILFKIPKDEEDRNLLFKIISKKHKIDLKLLNVLYSYYGESIYFIFSIFEGQLLKFPSTTDFKESGCMINIYKETTKMLEYGMEFKNIMSILSEKFNETENKIFVLYNKVMHILKEYEEEINFF